jgi:hypothetical protein
MQFVFKNLATYATKIRKIMRSFMEKKTLKITDFKMQIT